VITRFVKKVSEIMVQKIDGNIVTLIDAKGSSFAVRVGELLPVSHDAYFDLCGCDRCRNFVNHMMAQGYEVDASYHEQTSADVGN